MALQTTPGKNPMRAPESGVTIRMYRQGHGDCFLLCFRRSPDNDDPYFVLIDLGAKGSSAVNGVDTSAVIEDLAKATQGEIDLAIVTHEHEDHVSGFPFGDEPNSFSQNIKVRKLWLAWTEDEKDDFANELREEYGDQLLTLAMASAEMKALGLDSTASQRVDELLRFEIGDIAPASFLRKVASDFNISADELGSARAKDAHATAFAAAARAKKPKGYKYKMRLAGLRRHVKESNIRFLDPEAGKSVSIDGVDGVRVYPLGPPRDKKLLRSLNPHKKEEFRARGFGAADPGFGLFKAFAGRGRNAAASSPFAARYAIPEKKVLKKKSGGKKRSELDAVDHLRGAYTTETDDKESLKARRQIGGDWLEDAEALALRVNNEVNNTSLVLLFELPCSGKTLLFTGDAQRGNWISWKDLEFDGRSVRDLLAECVFYKAGHHGSHNATLKGTEHDEWPNLGWLARGDRAKDFTTMIPSNKDWAWATIGKGIIWKHPLPAIEKALIAKARGRVMITSDTKIPDYDEWTGARHAKMNKEHKARTKYRKHYIEHWIPDA